MTQIELLPIKNAYYLGGYHKVLTDIQSLPSQELQIQARSIAFRSLIAQKKYEAVMKSIVPTRDPPSLISIQLLVKYFLALHQKAFPISSVVQEMESLLEAGNNKLDPEIQLSGATLFYLENRLEDALRLVVSSPKDMECVAMAIQIYLKLDRQDIAKKELAKLKSWADDATLAQLVEAWVNLQIGGEDRYREAAYIFEELASSKIASPKMLNGHAVCLMQMGQFLEAEKRLLEAIEKDPSDGDVLANLCVVYNALNNPEASQKFLIALKERNPQHLYIQSLAQKSSLFDQALSRFKSL